MYKYTYIDSDSRTKIEGIIESALRDRDMELAFVRTQQVQKAVAKKAKTVATQQDKDLKLILKKVSAKELLELLKQVSG